MKLSDILTVERVEVRDGVADKPSALRALAELLEGAAPQLDTATITEVFEAREALASTGVGSEVAIPHGRAAGIESLVASAMILRDGVDFESIDGRPVHILIALLGPKNLDHLKALHRVSRVLRSAATRERLKASQTGAAAFEVLLDADR